MAKRRFKLPGIHDLSKEQEAARALDQDRQHLIIGGPGTGKSVLALMRSQRHHKNKDDYVFLVYNHLLNQASRQLYGDSLKSKTWISWFKGIFRDLTGQVIPLGQGGHWDINWDAVLAELGGSGERPERKLPYLVIDEGQDMPPQFYQALANLWFKYFYVVADQNQQIVPEKNSTRQEIQEILGIDQKEVIELQRNYRNTYPVARLAQEFYTDDPASPPPDLPKVKHLAKRPILYEYMPNKFNSLIGRILKMADLNPSWLIGIITPNNNIRKRYYDAFLAVDVQLDNVRPRVSTYYNGADPGKLRFDEGGIIVINSQSCKGLEFNVVFLADINEYYCNPGNADQMKRLFYVMVARAMDRVIMLKEAGKHCPVEVILPNDPEVLERKK